jgi:hypothetical protein
MGGDVAVDATDAGEAVAEAAGLGDLGDAVLDEPGLVAVAQIVEMHARNEDRVGVDRGAPGPAGEVSSALPAAAGAAEHGGVVVAVQQVAEQVDQERRQGL